MAEKQKQGRKPGRPARYPKGERSPTLTFRARGGLYEQLKAASAQSGLSLSEEIERRVAQSFDDIDALSRIVARTVQAASAFTGGTWRKDPKTLDVTLGMLVPLFMSLRLDPEGALLAEEAHKRYRYHLENAWRGPLPDDPFKGAPHLRPKPEGELAPEPVQEAPQEPAAKGRRKKRLSEPQSEPAE